MAKPTHQPTQPERDKRPPSAKADRKLDDALEDSFPASDPPAQTVPAHKPGTPKDHEKSTDTIPPDDKKSRH